MNAVRTNRRRRKTGDCYDKAPVQQPNQHDGIVSSTDILNGERTGADRARRAGEGEEGKGGQGEEGRGWRGEQRRGGQGRAGEGRAHASFCHRPAVVSC